MSTNGVGNRELLKLLGNEKFKKIISLVSKDELPGDSRVEWLESSRSFRVREGADAAGFLRLPLYFCLFFLPAHQGDPSDKGAIVHSASW